MSTNHSMEHILSGSKIKNGIEGRSFLQLCLFICLLVCVLLHELSQVISYPAKSIEVNIKVQDQGQSSRSRLNV